MNFNHLKHVTYEVGVWFYPYINFLFMDYLGLLLLFLALGFSFGMVERYFQHMQYAGLTRKELVNYQDNYRQHNNNQAPRYGLLANLDNPTKKVTMIRYLHRMGFVLSGWLFLGVFGFMAIGVVMESLAEYITLKKGYITQGSYYFLDARNLYGLAWVFVGVVAGFLLARFCFFLMRDAVAKKDARYNTEVVNSRKKTAHRSGEMSDARTLDFKQSIDFDPLAYFNAAKAKHSVFLGVSEDNEAVFIPRDIWKKSNVQIMGAVGSGKGVLACCALSQCVRNFDDCVIWFDPKNDEFAQHVLNAQTANFTLLDLRQGKPAQLNLFQGISSYELSELLTAGFSLGRKGDIADHYRDNDRTAVRYLANQFANGTNIHALIQAAHALPKEIKNAAKGFLTLLDELGALSVLKTDTGVDLKEIILNGGCLYVIGSLRDEAVIMLQKMLFVRCIQIIEARDRLQETTHVNILLDEFKYLLSKSSLEALGTVRDKNCNILLTHQSLGDFGQCGADMQPEAVKTTVIDNTPIKWIYRMKDFEAAKWASQQTGQILVDNERRKVSTDIGNIELVDHESTLFKSERALIDTNTLQHLPDGCAVLIGHGLARLAYSRPIRVKRAVIQLHEFPVLPPLNPYMVQDDNPIQPSGAIPPAQPVSKHNDEW